EAEDEARRTRRVVPQSRRERGLLRRREKAQRDLPDGRPRSEAGHPRRDRLRPGHRRPARRGQRREPAPQREARGAGDHALSAPAAVDTHGMSMSGRAAVEMVFVNGRLAVRHGDAGPIVRSLRDVGYEVDEYARYADYQRHPFTALNTANAQDGGLIVVPRGF